MNEYAELANAIIVQAATDYRNAREYIAGGVKRRFAEWEKRHIDEILDRERENETLTEAKVPKEHPLWKKMNRARRSMFKVLENERTVAEVEQFFKSNWYQTLGGTPDIFPKLKKEQDRKEKKNADKNYKNAIR